jgi:mono/diheme cytochrome c family protein
VPHGTLYRLSADGTLIRNLEHYMKTLTTWALLALAAGGLYLGVVQQRSTLESSGEGTGRWYNTAQLAQGELLFRQHCASCHGEAAEGVANWRELDANGHYPPPPLNGTAHAWHHPLEQLRGTVRRGGVPLGGQMPPFRTLLSDTEVDAVLAWVQSHWSAEIYHGWLQRGGLVRSPDRLF